MRPRWLLMGGLALAATLGVVAFLLIAARKPVGVAQGEDLVQCAHWSAFRCCQLLGNPASIREIVQKLPPDPRGHSLADVAEVLHTLGLSTEGRRDTWATLAEGQFPCIAHLDNPEHYVVVTSMESTGEYIHVFDDQGSRTRWRRDQFEQRWSGVNLRVSRNPSVSKVAANPALGKTPHLRFEYLLLDKGDIPAVGEPVEFAFPFVNVGDADLVIEDVAVSCGCISTEAPKQPIPPGGQGVIKLFYTVPTKQGAFSNTGLVSTNDKRIPQFVLTACGFSGVEVRMHPDHLTLDQLVEGEDFLTHCYLRYTGEWKDLEVGVESVSLTNAELVSHECRLGDEAGDTTFDEFGSRRGNGKPAQVLALVFRATGKSGDAVDGKLRIRTNIPDYEEYSVPVHGRIVSAIRAFPSILDFGACGPTDKLEQTVSLVAVSDRPFRVLGTRPLTAPFEIECPEGFVDKEANFKIRTTGEIASQWNGKKLDILCLREGTEEEVIVPLTVVVRNRGASSSDMEN